MVPVVLEMVRPAGSEGDTDQDTTVPPVEVGANALMDVPFVSVSEFWGVSNVGCDIVDNNGHRGGITSSSVAGRDRVARRRGHCGGCTGDGTGGGIKGKARWQRRGNRPRSDCSTGGGWGHGRHGRALGQRKRVRAVSECRRCNIVDDDGHGSGRATASVAGCHRVRRRRGDGRGRTADGTGRRIE